MGPGNTGMNEPIIPRIIKKNHLIEVEEDPWIYLLLL